MEWVLILGLGAVVAVLWNRIDRLEQRLRAIDQLQDVVVDQLRAIHRSGAPSAPITPADAVAEPVEGPTQAVPRLSVPSVALKRSEDAQSTNPTSEVVEDIVESAPEPARNRFQFDLEDVFGRRLPIWAGGVTLAVAGVLLVRYSIERGLITPLLRVVMAFVFGAGLIAGAEAAYRFRERVADPRVAQALAGAGLATLYAGFYLAGTQYGLIGQTFAFLGLAAVTAGAIALSFRFGLPSAVLGLVGGFAAPALVGGNEANLPLLALYLALVTGGLTFAGREQKREWMGIAALVGGLGWGALLLMTGNPGVEDLLALGLYLTVVGVLVPAFAASDRFELPVRLAAALVASVQLALLVSDAGYSTLGWGLYLLMGASLAFFGWRDPRLREANAVAATVALLLLALWSDHAGVTFALVCAALAAMFAAVPLAHLWRGEERTIDLWQAGLVPLAIATIAYAYHGKFTADLFEPRMALAILALAIFPALAVWRLWPREEARFLAIELAVAAWMLAWAAWVVTPAWFAPVAAGVVFAGLFMLLRRREDLPLRMLLWAGAALVALSLLGLVEMFAEAERLKGDPQAALGLRSLLRWIVPALAFAGLAWRETGHATRRAAEGLAVVFTYGALAQVLPGDALAWVAAVMAIGLLLALPGRIAARVAAIGIAVLWALGPLASWMGAALVSLVGEPLLVTAVPTLRDTALHLLPSVAALGTLRGVPVRVKDRAIGAEWVALVPLLVALHIGWKQAFAISTPAEFVTLGLTERTLWEALLLAGGWLLSRRLMAPGQLLVAAALGHFLVYTALWHDPLWARQAVGALPLANLLLPAYAIAILAALLLRATVPAKARPWLDGLVVALASLGTLSLLRQVYAGSILVHVPMSQGEDLLRSLLGIVLAIGFLLLGSRRGERSWRVGSLVLMVLAVLKVFIVDAAGLEGLLRVASFMALGFSLIGIGWLYSRQLRATPAPQ